MGEATTSSGFLRATVFLGVGSGVAASFFLGVAGDAEGPKDALAARADISEEFIMGELLFKAVFKRNIPQCFLMAIKIMAVNKHPQ